MLDHVDIAEQNALKMYIPSFSLIIRELEEIRDDLDQYVASCLTGKCGVPKCQN